MTYLASFVHFVLIISMIFWKRIMKHWQIYESRSRIQYSGNKLRKLLNTIQDSRHRSYRRKKLFLKFGSLFASEIACHYNSVLNKAVASFTVFLRKERKTNTFYTVFTVFYLKWLLTEELTSPNTKSWSIKINNVPGGYKYFCLQQDDISSLIVTNSLTNILFYKLGQ
jgi:hypothetical protein